MYGRQNNRWCLSLLSCSVAGTWLVYPVIPTPAAAVLSSVTCSPAQRASCPSQACKCLHEVVVTAGLSLKQSQCWRVGPGSVVAKIEFGRSTKAGIACFVKRSSKERQPRGGICQFSAQGETAKFCSTVLGAPASAGTYSFFMSWRRECAAMTRREP